MSIGEFATAAGGTDAILGAKGNIAAILKDPGGQGKEWALAVNDIGKSVGYADIAGGGTEAVLWQVDGKATNLSPLLPGWTNTEATGINLDGDILGSGTVAGHTEAFDPSSAAATSTHYHLVTSPDAASLTLASHS